MAYDNEQYTQIDEFHEKRTIPIVAGGTSYWVQHLLFPGRLVSLEGQDASLSSPSVSSVSANLSPAFLHNLSTLPMSLRDIYSSLPPTDQVPSDTALALHSLLVHLDPSVGARWHWKDTRKVLRNLHIIQESGRLVSEIMEEQDGAAVDAKPR